MTKLVLSILIISCSLFENNVLPQALKTENSAPKYYSTVTIGAIEGFSLSVGKYFRGDFSVGIKFSMFATEGGGLSTHAGIGIGGKYHFNNILGFEYLAAAYIKMFESSYNGHAGELTLGNNTNNEMGFGFIYELGIGYSNVLAEFSSPQYERKILLGPIIKIGLNYNF